MTKRRIAIIGNSFVGAVRRAWVDSISAETNDLQIDFGAAGGVNFVGIDVLDGLFSNLRPLADAPLAPVAEYEIIFIYGLFPYPAEVASVQTSLQASGYSKAVVNAAITDYLAASDGWQVRLRVAAATSAPVIMLSGNARSDHIALTPTSIEAAISAITEFVGCYYLAPPTALVGSAGQPDVTLYKGSVDIRGRNAEAADAQAKHDVHHLNPVGGSVVLRAILDRARKTLQQSVA